MGLFIKLLKKKLIPLEIDKTKQTYREKSEKRSPKDMEETF